MLRSRSEAGSIGDERDVPFTLRRAKDHYDDEGVIRTRLGKVYLSDRALEYPFDAKNNLTAMAETINGTRYTTSYTYDDDNRVTSKTTDGITVEYTYDALGRITKQVTKNGNATILTESYTYTANSSQVKSYTTSQNGNVSTINYTYDDNGNIINESRNNTRK